MTSSRSRASPPPAASARRRSSAVRPTGVPSAMVRSAGCRVWDADGREYLDLVMALGAVALGLRPSGGDGGRGAPRCATASSARCRRSLEEELAAELARLIPWVEQVRFLKTGAEAMAAAVRLARAVTGREAVLGCGYHGWLDWCQAGDDQGVPAAHPRALRRAAVQRRGAHPRAHPARGRQRWPRWCSSRSSSRPPDPDVARRAAGGDRRGSGALLIADEIKTVGRLAIGRRLRALRHAARSRRDGEGDRQRLSARGGRRSRGGHGRRWAGPGSPPPSPPSGSRSPRPAPRSACMVARQRAGAPRPRRGAAAGRASASSRSATRASCAAWRACRRCAACSIHDEAAGAALAVEAARRGPPLQAVGVQLRLAGARRGGGRPARSASWTSRSTTLGARAAAGAGGRPDRVRLPRRPRSDGRAEACTHTRTGGTMSPRKPTVDELDDIDDEDGVLEEEAAEQTRSEAQRAPRDEVGLGGACVPATSRTRIRRREVAARAHRRARALPARPHAARRLAGPQRQPAARGGARRHHHPRRLDPGELGRHLAHLLSRPCPISATATTSCSPSSASTRRGSAATSPSIPTTPTTRSREIRALPRRRA